MPYSLFMGDAITMATGHLLSRVVAILTVLVAPSRWIGRCKGCGVTAKVEGRVATTAPTATTRDVAIVAVDGSVYSTRIYSDASLVLKRCACDRYVLLRQVTEGTKNSKHTCGSKCTNATGPSCDCRCKGANHGRNC